MSSFLNAIQDYVVRVSYRNPATGAMYAITAYTGTPEPEYYTIQRDVVIYKPMSLNFIEL